MATKGDICLEAGVRLGDETTEFVTGPLDKAFDWVLLDLARERCIPWLKTNFPDAIFAEDQSLYSVDSLVGLDPGEVMAVDTITFYNWGPCGRLRGPLIEDDWIRFRLQYGDESARGRPMVWRQATNVSISEDMIVQDLEIWPPPTAEFVSTSPEPRRNVCDIGYFRRPVMLETGDDIIQIAPEHLEVLVQGIVARRAGFGEDPAAIELPSVQLYLASRQRLWGQVHNNRVGHIRLAGNSRRW